MKDGVHPRSAGVPRELADLVRAVENGRDAEAAWATFLGSHSALLLNAVRSPTGDHDRTMDRYAFVIDRLRAESFRKLRAYRSDGRTKFTTWLVVVTKRLVVDHHRSRYGRPQAPSVKAGGRDEHQVRRRLVDLIVADVDLGAIEDPAPHADSYTVGQERRRVLETVLRELDSDDRLLLTLRFVDGATARDITDTMGFPSQFHVYRSLRRVTRHLKHALRARGISSSDDL